MSIFSTTFVDWLHECQCLRAGICLHLPYDHHVHVDHVNCVLSPCLDDTVGNSIWASIFVRGEVLYLNLDFFSCWSCVELWVWNV